MVIMYGSFTAMFFNEVDRLPLSTNCSESSVSVALSLPLEPDWRYSLILEVDRLVLIHLIDGVMYGRQAEIIPR